MSPCDLKDRKVSRLCLCLCNASTKARSEVSCLGKPLFRHHRCHHYPLCSPIIPILASCCLLIARCGWAFWRNSRITLARLVTSSILGHPLSTSSLRDVCEAEFLCQTYLSLHPRSYWSIFFLFFLSFKSFVLLASKLASRAIPHSPARTLSASIVAMGPRNERYLVWTLTRPVCPSRLVKDMERFYHISPNFLKIFA